jgi:hypothetical protein
LMCYAYVLFFALSGYKIREPRLPVVAGYIAPVEIA